MNKKIFALLLCCALCCGLLPAVARADVGFTISAAVSCTDRNANTEALDLLPGDTVTVTVFVTGERYVGAACRLSFDADKFVLDTLPEGWAQDTENNVLSYFNVSGSDEYYTNGTLLGTFIFRVKSSAAAGTGSFTLSDTYVAADWSEGYSDQPAEECARFPASVNVLTAKAVQKETTEYVSGYSLVLVYTDYGTQPYAYDDAAMYDVSDAGYLFNDLDYAHVYALVIEGAAELSRAAAVEESAGTVSYSHDVDGSGTIEPADAIAVQAVYNTSAMTDMLVVLRADINGDKTVDIFDAADILRQRD